MSGFWLGLLIGLWVGAAVGIMTMALLTINSGELDATE